MGDIEDTSHDENPKTLHTMLEEVTPEQVHGEIDYGDSVGNEAW